MWIFPFLHTYWLIYFPNNNNIRIIRKKAEEKCPKPSRGLKSEILQTVIVRNVDSYNNPLNLLHIKRQRHYLTIILTINTRTGCWQGLHNTKRITIRLYRDAYCDIAHASLKVWQQSRDTRCCVWSEQSACITLHWQFSGQIKSKQFYSKFSFQFTWIVLANYFTNWRSCRNIKMRNEI